MTILSMHAVAVNVCCSAKMSRASKTDTKFKSGLWQRVKNHASKHNPEVCFDTLWVCQFCRVLLNKDKLLSRCVLNGLESEPIPAELANLDALSKQLIQRAKAFQAIVHLGTYTAKVPKYNSLKACKGTMFFLPLPLEKTLETLGEVRQPGVARSLDSPAGKSTTHLSHPELYILVNGKPNKLKVVWRTLVNVDALKAAIHKLKEINWLYKEVDEDDLDDVTREVIETVSDTSSTMLEKATKEDVAGFQSFTIHTLNSKQSTSSDIDQYKLLNVKEDALDNRQKYLDVLCFPDLFPTGRFGECHPREVHITKSEYAKSRLMNKDSRFRKDPAYVFYLLWQKELRELASGVYNLLKSTGQPRLPVGHFLNSISESDPNIEANLSTMFQQIRGTKQFWFLKASDLKCMLKEYGSPTLFLTFSCAEYQSPDISSYLRKVNDVPDSYPIGKLCCEDPISVSRKFSQKFHAFFSTVIMKGHVLGTVSHYFVKKEYQARGVPHYHMVLWIEGAPIIGRDMPEEVMRWIQERISCRIPDEDTNPELHLLVIKYQMHKCSSYCRRTKRVNKAFVTRCKFGFPRDASKDGALKCVEDSLKSRAKIYTLPRADSEIRVNDYSPLLLLLWKANIDIQFIAESSMALAHYVTAYVTKAEQSNMQEVWQEVGSNKSIYSRLWSLVFEVCVHVSVASTKHVISSWVITFVRNRWPLNAMWSHKRKWRLINHSRLRELQDSDPESSNIFESNLVDDYYPRRCRQLEDVCLYDLVRDYDRVGVDKDDQYTYSKLTKPHLPNHKLFDPEKENQREDFFYSLLLLFVPFCREADLLGPDETAEEAFQRHMQPGSSLVLHHDKLQQMLAARAQVKKINEARQEDQPPPGAQDDARNDGPQIDGEAQSAMNDVRDLEGDSANHINLEERVSMMNKDQTRVFQLVKEHLLH